MEGGVNRPHPFRVFPTSLNGSRVPEPLFQLYNVLTPRGGRAQFEVFPGCVPRAFTSPLSGQTRNHWVGRDEPFIFWVPSTSGENRRS